MTNEEEVIESICKMDIKLVATYIDINWSTYSDFHREGFLLDLKGAFEDLKKAGNTVLIAHSGYCNDCKKDKAAKGYAFIGNNSEHFITFLFTINEKDRVSDLCKCCRFKTNDGKEVDENRRIYFESELPF